jgi:hypothetical protein
MIPGGMTARRLRLLQHQDEPEPRHEGERQGRDDQSVQWVEEHAHGRFQMYDPPASMYILRNDKSSRKTYWSASIKVDKSHTPFGLSPRLSASKLSGG